MPKLACDSLTNTLYVCDGTDAAGKTFCDNAAQAEKTAKGVITPAPTGPDVAATLGLYAQQAAALKNLNFAKEQEQMTADFVAYRTQKTKELTDKQLVYKQTLNTINKDLSTIANPTASALDVSAVINPLSCTPCSPCADDPTDTSIVLVAKSNARRNQVTAAKQK